ncbi:efflux RND transporter periplasmic adaptor subunit [Persicimonas caeni]|uniref:Efflux RND transporter periplasmic adaptor subunit n=1 Tax=Persicimonas caeni TaxID=2292766 RepID=A0A4Y6PYU0_PERCE|nr:efflux RND transporter periplasmic adaptor subunit [Persicimonas caeni]QDG53491.1 efflux RND transporter periplasmic adaptor subunit [Persicimonas caeni]QED34712.1 efflux RND transporter periplasmic adaptor subunit [Persicimonas caeni]
MTRRSRIIAIVLGVAVLAVGVGVYFWLSAAEKVDVVRVEPRDVVEVVIASGRLRSRSQSALGVERGGVVGQVTVEEGVRVEEGELLVALRSEDLQSRVAQAEAQLAAANQSLTQLRQGPTAAERSAASAEIERAEAAVENAQDDYKRAEKLVAAGVETGANLDAARTRLAEARANLRAAKARREQLDPRSTQVEQARARVDEAGAALEVARAELAKATVRAPFSGLVLDVDAERGQSVSPGQPLLTLASLDDAEYLVETDEDNIGQLQVGQPAYVYFPSKPDKTFNAEVRQIGPEIDTDRGVVSVHLEPTKLPDNAFPGLTVDVNIVVERLEDAPAVPVTSLLRDGDETSVLVVDGTSVEQKAVDVRANGRDWAAIEGIEPGTLVVEKATSVEPGAKVEPQVRDISSSKGETSK